MYFGRQGVGMYDPQDEQTMTWGGSSLGRDVGTEMAKRRAMVDQQDQQAAGEAQQARAMDIQQAAHERNLQASEQQRRMYDSQTARMGQSQKFGVLGGLLRGGMGGGMGGMVTRTYGDVPASQRG